jgi:hypothetical protein
MHLAQKTIGAKAVGIDGDLGTVIDFYFEHDPLAVRYLLVDTSGRLNGTRLLISTQAVHRDWDVTGVHLSLTKADARDSQAFQVDQPVSGDSDDLWSVVESTGYHVRATNGDIGLVDDFLIRQDFRVPFLIVDTSDWLSGRSVVVSSNTLERVDRAHGLIYVNTSRDTIEHAPTV